MKLDLPKFEDKRELIEYIVSNKTELIDLKKSAIKYADACGGFVSTESGILVKAENANSRDTDDVIYRTIIGNTYNWMDSHDDAHLNYNFAQSIKDRNGRIYHRHDHVPKLTAKVGKFSNVYEKNVNWTDLGVNKSGQTMSLLADSAIKRSYNSLIFESYKDGEIDQHSVGMRYIKIFLGVNDKEYKEEFEVWNKYSPLLGNLEKATDKGFCFFVKEASLIEISCVTDGSNELTGMYPSNDSINNDPQLSSQKTVWDLLAPDKTSKTVWDNYLKN